MSTTAEEIWELLGELIKVQKETDRLLREQSQETNRKFQETDRKFQETDKKFQETDRFLREQSQETDRKFQETDKKFQETDRFLREQSQETDRKFQETNRKFQETEYLLREQSERANLRFQETERLIKEESIRLDKQLGQIGNSLGQFVEFQVRPAAVRLFQEMGIAVKEIATNVSVQGSEGTEIDILVVNSHEAIAIEVKSKLSDDDVKEHIARLSEFKKLLPRYENLNIMGAVAGMVVPENVARFAYRQGLFVIGQSGDNLVILNDDKFKPRCW
ncbi:hypothetical protein [Cylindrospermopsis raciborskii]|uniref:DUF3782 domain-containing protein n=1 Tax=Cylindrospermopsis raciborskii CENA302 TaxID=1170768 RepID=A0A9Q5QYI0_9CYAN|nr:hypothetical protein [Cylindrospermopsis raciborskii]OPH10928.1 hypothetical protein CENA302_02160 [Cylindrospermopsis raciborskii CENA302]